jgi:hypothetical protein
VGSSVTWPGAPSSIIRRIEVHCPSSQLDPHSQKGITGEAMTDNRTQVFDVAMKNARTIEVCRSTDRHRADHELKLVAQRLSRLTFRAVTPAKQSSSISRSGHGLAQAEFAFGQMTRVGVNLLLRIVTSGTLKGSHLFASVIHASIRLAS